MSHGSTDSINSWLARVLSLFVLAGCGHVPTRVESGLAIVGAAVIDMTGTEVQMDMTVVVQDGNIAIVAPSRNVTLGPGVEQADGSGRYLIPGLWDMHTHVAEYAPIWLPVMLANGITGVRNMHAVSVELINIIKHDMETGTLVGPRLVANGPLVDGPATPWPTATIVDSTEAGTLVVASLAAAGADFIKVYSFLSHDVYFAIAEKAKGIDIPFAGHVPQSISALEATRAGQHSIEHLDGVLMATASDETELRQRFEIARDAWRNPATAAEGQVAMVAINHDLVSHYDAQKATILFAAFTANDTYQVPTLVTHYTNIHRAEQEILANPALRYIPASIRAQWLSLPPPQQAMAASQLEQYMLYEMLVQKMQAEGVPVLAGTDTGGAFIVPGDSLHRELALLVEAGLTPLQALQYATTSPAAYFDEVRSTGTVEVGKSADLVLLNANPLEDISNTRNIAAVVRAGVLFDRNELDGMLEQAEAAAAAQ